MHVCVCMSVCLCVCVCVLFLCVCVCVCVRERDRETERKCGRDTISEKTKYMHSEDSDKLVYLSSLMSLHLRYMDNEHNASLSY